MQTYGAWQNDALAAIRRLLSGEQPDSQWSVTGSSAAVDDFHLAPDGRIVLIPFGTVRRTDTFPFFANIVKDLTLDQLPTRFPLSPAAYQDAKTNKTLALTVAAKLATNSSDGTLVVVLSDFLADATLYEPQLDFINSTEALYSVRTFATFSWKADRRLQIKLMKYVPETATSASPSTRGLLRLSAQFLKSSSSLRLSWTYDGPQPAERYSVRAADPRKGTTLFAKSNLIARTITYPRPPAGPVKWSVTAHLSDGTTVQQTATIQVPSHGSAIGLLIVFALIALGVIAWLAFRQRGLLRRRSDNRKPAAVD
jgi:hypothetical protein